MFQKEDNFVTCYLNFSRSACFLVSINASIFYTSNTERISKLNNRSIEIVQSTKHRKEVKNKQKFTHTKIEDTIKCSNMHKMGVPEKEEEAEDFSNLMKNINLFIQEV